MLWGQKYESKWSKIREIICEKTKQLGYINEFCKDFLMKFIISMSFRGAKPNVYFENIVSHFVDHICGLDKVDIPENERVKPILSTASKEVKHTLQSQMNPHFLMNTLNTLKFMAISAHYTGMQDMVVALENILAAVLNRDGGFYTVRDEQSVLESYIYIMQFRYMDSFEVDINLSPGILDCKVPKLILQPIVENCITHGFDNLGDRLGRITVTGTIQEGNLIFEITDNGKGMDQATVQRILG